MTEGDPPAAGAPRAPSLHLSNLEKRFGSIQAVAGVDLDWEGPGIVGVVGPNGSGKTTLIRCLLGLAKPTDGVVLIDEELPSRAIGPDGPGVGYMPQREALYQALTVHQNVDFFAKLYRVEPNRREASVQDALAFVDLEERAHHKVKTLSGGMQRRVSLACALVHSPPLLMLDEPTVGVDPELRAEMWEGLRAMREQGRLILVSTHYLAEAERCDQVLLLRRGQVLAFDRPETLMEATGTGSLEEAFLHITQEEPGEPGGPSEPEEPSEQGAQRS